MASTLREELSAVGVDRFTAREYRPGVVRHLVFFRFRGDVAQHRRDEAADRFARLIDSRRPDGGTYIRSIELSGQRSGEEAGPAFDLGVVVTFASVGDRNYYIGTPIVDDPRHFDADHAAFKEFVGPLLAADGVFVFDVHAG